MSVNSLRNIVRQMKRSSGQFKPPRDVISLGSSRMFDYALSPDNKDSLQAKKLKQWNNLEENEIKMLPLQIPLNGFEEMIQLTEQGKLWRYPIDNEQGLEKEQQVPFENHVFLEEHLQNFPKNEYIQSFMGLVIAGLAKNHWITVERKVKTIQFYKDYFDRKRGLYKAAGYDIA